MAPRNQKGRRGPGRCPLCHAQLYGWLTLSSARGATVGMPLPDDADETVVDRCEDCGVALPRGRRIDLGRELAAITSHDGSGAELVQAPNRASWQASIGLEGWAAIREAPGQLLLTPRSLELLARQAGPRSLERVSYPTTRRSLRWIWQTLLNGLTYYPNFAREVRAGRLRWAEASKLRYATDAVASLLAAPFVIVLSTPVELLAGLLRRGGEMRAELGMPQRDGESGGGLAADSDERSATAELRP